MKLFGKKQPELPDNFLDDEPAVELAGVDQNSVLDYLLQLKSEDYDKLLQLVKIYREANKKAGALIPQYDPDLAETVEVQQFGEGEPIAVTVGHTTDEDAIDEFLNEELETAFIEDDTNAPKKAKSKNVGRN